MSTTTKRKASLEDAWAAIEALVETQQKTETELARQKTALARQKTEESLRESQKKTEEAQQKTEESLRESQKKTEEYLQKLGENLDKANGTFNHKWGRGRLLENLVGGNLISLLQDRGIKVDDLHERVKGFRGGRQVAEYGLVAANEAEAVAFEVKTTLIKDNVTKFLGQLKDFKANCSNLVGNRTVYGGVAYFTIDDKEHTEKES